MRNREELRQYQQRAIEFVKDHDNCALFIDVGLGKTSITLTAFKELQHDFRAHKALVIAPLRVAKRAWIEEIGEWAHLQGLTTSKILGTEKQRLAGLNAEADIYLINYENLVWLIEQFIEGKKQVRHWPFDFVVADESQALKSQSSKRWKALRRIRRLFLRLVELTGTPAPLSYRDLWSQVYLLDRGQRLGVTETAFLERWFREHRGDGYSTWSIKDGSAAEIHAALADIVLSLKVEDYFDLPPVVFNPIRVSMSPAALAVYRKFKRTAISDFNGKTVTAASAGVLSGKLLQLANGIIYTGVERQFEVFHDEKLDALIEHLDSCTGPIIVAYGFVADAARISKALREYCGQEKTWAVADSDASLDKFARGKTDVLLCHPASVGHGLNDMHRSGATNIVWYGLTNRLEHWLQLNGRLTGGHRRAGKNIVVSAILTDDTEDQRAWESLIAKEATQDALTRALVR